MRRGLQAGDGAGGGGALPEGPGGLTLVWSVMNGKNATDGRCTCACGKVGCLATALSSGVTGSGGPWLQLRGDYRP